MSRDDYISKLFIDNQDKLEQAPSDDFWSKLEAKLETEMPVQQVADKAPVTRILQFPKFVAAASVLLAIVGSSYLFQMATDLQNQESLAAYEVQLEEPMALLTDNEEKTEPEPYEDEEVLPANVVEEVDKAEEKAQEEKIVIALNEVVKENADLASTQSSKIKIEEFAIKDKVNEKANDTEFSLITVELEEEPDPTTLGSSSLVGGDNVSEEKRNYSSFNNVSQQMNNSISVEEVLNKSENARAAMPRATSDLPAAKKEETSKKRKGSRSKIFGPAKGKSQKIKSPMAAAHGRLQPFGFLLGRWLDENGELEGTSYETWSLKNATTLVGKGYKLSNDGDRIFEEMMRIEYRDNQIFLVISLDENNQSMDYMLSSFDNERFIFKQNGMKEYPDKVVIQKSIDGYSVIIMNDKDFLTTDQQRYLDNRNRVSNVRSIRNMSFDE